MRRRADEPLVNRQVRVHHAIERKVARDRIAAVRGIGKRRGEALHHVVNVTADPSVHAVLHDLFDGTAGEREHRRTAGHRLDHDESEGLLPLNREEYRPGARQQGVLLFSVGFANVFDQLAVDARDHFLFPVVAEHRLDLSGQLQSDAGAARDFDGDVRPLARSHAAEEDDIVVFC